MDQLNSMCIVRIGQYLPTLREFQRVIRSSCNRPSPAVIRPKLSDIPNVVVKPDPLPNLQEPGYYAMCKVCFDYVAGEDSEVAAYKVKGLHTLSNEKLASLHEGTHMSDIFVPSFIEAMAAHIVYTHGTTDILPVHVVKAARTVLKLHSPGVSILSPYWNAQSTMVQPIPQRQPQLLPGSLAGMKFDSFAKADVYLLTAVGLDGTTFARSHRYTEMKDSRLSPIGAIYRCKNATADKRPCEFGIALQSERMKNGKRRPPYDMTIRRDVHTCRLKARIETPQPGREDARPQAGPSDTGGQASKRRRVESKTEGIDNEVENVAPAARAAALPARDGPSNTTNSDRSAMRLDSLGLPADALRMLTAAGMKTYGDLLQAGLPMGSARPLFSALREYLEGHPNPSEEDSRAEISAVIAALALDSAMTAQLQPDVAIASIRGFGPELLEFFALADMRTIGDLEQAGLSPRQARMFVREVQDYLATRPQLVKDQVAAELRYVIAALRLS